MEKTEQGALFDTDDMSVMIKPVYKTVESDRKFEDDIFSNSVIYTVRKSNQNPVLK